MFTLPKQKTASPLGHSADVSLFLHTQDGIRSLSHTSGMAIRLSDDVFVAPGPARVEIITDGVSHFSDVIVSGRRPNTLWLEIADA
jgi:hypothetical protein